MSLQCRILNGICRFLYKRKYDRFVSECDIKKVQNEYLMRLLKKNANTGYGKRYDFAHIKSYEQFAENVPITVYEDYESYIDTIAEGEKNVLTSEEILLFELTSGSSGGKKRIPYTKALKREFQEGIKPWLYDLYASNFGVSDGKSYWSITPVTSEKTFTKCGIPMGFEEDVEYFGFIEQFIMRKIFAVDSKVKFSDDMEDFYEKTACQLLACKELTLISVWNPTFLTILCDFIREHIDTLLEAVEENRQKSVREAVLENRFDKVFPMLRIISCWADGSAKDYVSGIKERFPTVTIQAKGLLATECFVSFPLVGETGSRLSIYSHFFEFKRVSDGKIVMANDLTPGEYEVIVTTGGGFYRYCLKDIVEVLEVFKNHPPLIRFIRRGGITSDLFGEKLTEEFVRNVCKKLCILEEFCLLAPEGNGYCFYTTAENITDDLLDDALRESYHYNYCRQLGQLKKARVIVVSGDTQKAYMGKLTAEGMRIGDIKPSYLTTKTGWQSWFQMRKEE